MAQQRTIKGTVSDKDGPIPMANVMVKNTTKGVAADFDGKYEITVSDGETLVFSSSGSQAREFKITSKTSAVLDVTLKEDVKELEEFVVVGYGVQRKSDVTGAVASLREDELKRTVATSIDQAMQGRVSGVQVTQSTGQPGSATSVRIRGTSTLMGSNEPLYVVDGIPIGGIGGGGANPLAAINPADIVSMEVLKDASATAIYGSRGANGVVMITTRKGKAGEARISYDGSFMVAKVSKKLDVMNLKEYSAYASNPDIVIAYGQQPRYIDQFLKVDHQFLGEGSDWQDAMFRTAYGHTHQLSVTGGSQETTYAMSLGYQDQKGTMIGTDFERFNGRINLENQTKKWLKTGLNMAFTHISQAKQDHFDAINTGGSLTGTNVDDSHLINALVYAPNYAIYDIEGGFVERAANIHVPRNNPISQALQSPTYQKSYSVMGQVFIEAELYKDLRWRTEFGVDYSNMKDSKFLPTTDYRVNNQLSMVDRNSFYWRVASTLSYYKKFLEKQSISAMVTAEAQESSWSGTNNTHIGYPFEITDPTYHTLGLGAPSTSGGYKGGNTMASYLGRVNYNYDERYLLTATGRFDGSSNFAAENRWGFFPSFSLAWRINQEHFIKESEKMNEVFSNLKLRAGYGQTGNSGIGMAHRSTLRSYGTYEGAGASALLIQWPNTGLIWETNFTYNGGLDVGLFNNRISLTFDAFYKQNNDLIVRSNPGATVAIDSWENISPPIVNLGSIRNTGFEISLNTVNIDTKIGRNRFEWTTDFSFSKVKNLIVKLDEARPESQYWRTAGRAISRSEQGYAPGLFYGYKTNGIIQNEEQLNEVDRSYFAGIGVGDLRYLDVSGPDGVPDGIVDEWDRTFIGDPNPDFTGGLGNTFSYGPWSLTIFLTYSYGSDVYNIVRTTLEGQESLYRNQLRTVQNCAIVAEDENGSKYVTNAGTNVPRPNPVGAPVNLNSTSDHWIEDGSFLRIQNIALSYRFPRRWTDKININDLKLTGNVQNIYTFTNYSGFNPEVNNSNVLRQGIDTGSYPVPRVYTVNLSFNF